jgi:hypothetical protein
MERQWIPWYKAVNLSVSCSFPGVGYRKFILNLKLASSWSALKGLILLLTIEQRQGSHCRMIL